MPRNIWRKRDQMNGIQNAVSNKGERSEHWTSENYRNKETVKEEEMRSYTTITQETQNSDKHQQFALWTECLCTLYTLGTRNDCDLWGGVLRTGKSQPFGGTMMQCLREITPTYPLTAGSWRPTTPAVGPCVQLWSWDVLFQCWSLVNGLVVVPGTFPRGLRPPSSPGSTWLLPCYLESKRLQPLCSGAPLIWLVIGLECSVVIPGILSQGLKYTPQSTRLYRLLLCSLVREDCKLCMLVLPSSA